MKIYPRPCLQTIKIYLWQGISVLTFCLIGLWPKTLKANKGSDTTNIFTGDVEIFKGNKFSWYNSVDTDYVLDPITDTPVFILFSYPEGIRMVNDDSVCAAKLSDFTYLGYQLKNYFNETIKNSVPEIPDSIEALSIRHLIINERGQINFYKANWYHRFEYYEIADSDLLNKIDSMLERSGPWANPTSHCPAYIQTGFTLYFKEGITHEQ